MTHLWPAPTPGRPIHATVAIPGSKSLTNRWLVLAALATGSSRISKPLVARDTQLMADALVSLGTAVESDGDAWVVTPGPLSGGTQVDCGLAGTVMRFIPPIAALADGPVRFDGDPRARVRPMTEIVGALRQLGTQVDDDGRGTLPFTVHGRHAVPGGEVTIDASASSQFVSALLLAGARYDSGIVIRHEGPTLPSLPHIDMSVECLASVGVHVEADTDDPSHAQWIVHPGAISAFNVTVEPDLSNAAPFLAAALVTGGSVTIPDWPTRTSQAGDHLRWILEAMGADVALGHEGLTVTGSGSIKGIDVDLHDVGELTPVVAAVAALAQSPTHIRGVAHLRGHETDRLDALTVELGGLGAGIEQTADGLVIKPAQLHEGQFATYDDHRMAMAGAVVGLAVSGVEVTDIATTAKTLPDFAGMWSGMVGA